MYICICVYLYICIYVCIRDAFLSGNKSLRFFCILLNSARNKASQSNSGRKIHRTGTPDRFQTLPGPKIQEKKSKMTKNIAKYQKTYENGA